MSAPWAVRCAVKSPHFTQENMPKTVTLRVSRVSRYRANVMQSFHIWTPQPFNSASVCGRRRRASNLKSISSERVCTSIACSIPSDTMTRFCNGNHVSVIQTSQKSAARAERLLLKCGGLHKSSYKQALTEQALTELAELGVDFFGDDASNGDVFLKPARVTTSPQSEFREALLSIWVPSGSEFLSGYLDRFTATPVFCFFPRYSAPFSSLVVSRFVPVQQSKLLHAVDGSAATSKEARA